MSSYLNGASKIKEILKNIPQKPGVYWMLDETETILYIGKAKNLSKRITNYTQGQRLTYRIQKMVASTHKMDFIQTHTETEALLLESNLIKKHLPRFNILLKDDKSFSYIEVTKDQYPMLTKYRGKKREGGTFFGPFPSGSAVTKTIIALQKSFLLRNCSNAVFKNRTRPCLQYFIKRCSAPCVGKVSVEDYQSQVKDAKGYLSGQSAQILKHYKSLMLEASQNQDYEKAAHLRDRLKILSAMTTDQNIHIQGLKDVDVIVLFQKDGVTCIEVFFFRSGSHFGNRAYFPNHHAEDSKEDIISAFLGQFYVRHAPPPQLLLNLMPLDQALLEKALSEHAGYAISFSAPKSGKKKQLIDFALLNAEKALERKQNESLSQGKLLAHLQDLFKLPKPPERIEIYDNSHIQGTSAVGTLIVAGPEGFIKNAYRKFNIDDEVTKGDDFAMMSHVFNRRFSKASENLPDLILIDGGKGQLSSAYTTMKSLNLCHIPLVAIAKGPDRNAGKEHFFKADEAGNQTEIKLKPGDILHFYLERLRDEAHRFAIGSHRQLRQKNAHQSELDKIEGIGPSRKKALLHHFGSVKNISSAALEDLKKVDTISQSLAEKIYNHFH